MHATIFIAISTTLPSFPLRTVSLMVSTLIGERCLFSSRNIARTIGFLSFLTTTVKGSTSPVSLFSPTICSSISLKLPKNFIISTCVRCPDCGSSGKVMVTDGFSWVTSSGISTSNGFSSRLMSDGLPRMVPLPVNKKSGSTTSSLITCLHVALCPGRPGSFPLFLWLGSFNSGSVRDAQIES